MTHKSPLHHLEGISERFEKYAASNLNDGEYPIPESGRMVQLQFAVDVLKEKHITEYLTFIDMMIGEVEGKMFKDTSEAGQFRLHADGYNQAHEELLSSLKAYREIISKQMK